MSKYYVGYTYPEHDGQFVCVVDDGDSGYRRVEDVDIDNLERIMRGEWRDEAVVTWVAQASQYGNSAGYRVFNVVEERKRKLVQA